MPVAEAARSSAIEHLQLANEVRSERSAQRSELRGQPPRVLVPVLLNPPRELSTYRLWELLGSRTGGLVRGMGEAKLTRVLAMLNSQYCIREWHRNRRLRELTPQERRALANALVRLGPKRWRTAT